MPRRWGLWSIVIVRLALGAASPGCGSGSGAATGTAGAHGTAGASGTAGAGAAGTGDAAGVSGGAGATAAAGAGDASADALAPPGSGIPVYVIGIGTDPVLVQNLQQMAMAGGRPRPGDPAYYPVESSADLVDALRAIGAQSAPCTYALPTVPLAPNDVVIKAANVVVPHDTTHAEGWDYDANATSIRLFGTWCTKDQAGALTNVEETAPCAGMK
jgi:hypothetical protein